MDKRKNEICSDCPKFVEIADYCHEVFFFLKKFTVSDFLYFLQVLLLVLQLKVLIYELLYD